MGAVLLIGLISLLGPASGSGGATRATTEPRSSCAAVEVRSAVVSFVTAFNRGDYERLDALFAEEPKFEWYSSPRPGLRLGRSARRRSTLIPYLRARHKAGDRFDLTSFGFNGNSPRYGNFEMDVRRSSPEFRHGKWFEALSKGAAICDGDSVEFIVMSHGGPFPNPARGAAKAQARS